MYAYACVRTRGLARLAAGTLGVRARWRVQSPIRFSQTLGTHDEHLYHSHRIYIIYV